MEILIAIGLFCICFGMVIVVLNNSQFVRFLYYLLGILGTTLMVIGINEMQPSAMDVYQGKTTLKYTYVDSVKVDSIVIFKEERK